MAPPTGVKPPPLAGWLRIDYHLTNASAKGMYTRWVSYDATEAEAADDLDLNAIEAKVRNDWLTYDAPSISVDWALTQIVLVLFRASGELRVTYTTAAGGGASGAQTSAQASWCVNWDTHAFYRGGKPKNFIPGLTISMMDDARIIDSTYSSALEVAMNAWIGNVHTYTSTHLTTSPVPIAPSFVHDKAYRVTALQRQIYRAWVQKRVCTQRRRVGAAFG